MVMKRQSLDDNQQHPAVAPCPLPVSFVAVADFSPSQKAPLMLGLIDAELALMELRERGLERLCASFCKYAGEKGMRETKAYNER
jgi:hypothetical protein